MEEKYLIPDYESNFAVLVAYITQYKNQGYNVYSDISEIKKLIDFIVNWYEVKYPDNIIEMSKEFCVDKHKNIIYFKRPRHKVRKTENLSKYMDYYQLILRLPESIYQILESWYKGEDYNKNDKFTTRISLKDSLAEHNISFQVYSRDGALEIRDIGFFDIYKECSLATIDDLLDMRDEFEFNYSENSLINEYDEEDDIYVNLNENLAYIYYQKQE